jgi:hypothetical protein
MIEEIFEPDAIDFYDWDELDKLQEKSATRFFTLLSKAKDGDKKAKEALRKHKAEEKILKTKATITGYHWA